jgi:hypothetical protein
MEGKDTDGYIAPRATGGQIGAWVHDVGRTDHGGMNSMVQVQVEP